ncbi:hypothetical protein [Umezawaea endophytica]|uniref:Uncharacterized protein n=1 Tax=Umezawaea endophytica TaxID=1654476 RepID=A0A9X2VRS4_9PSEU|nr:hypothetical protein [Umezawaea endophytica]MCS7481626.1 hypothetical protein [Umezawaea endophytica]
MNTEDLVRESLRRQADRAPAPGPVLAALHRPRRGRTLAMAVAAVVGVLVVAAGVVALRQNLADPPPPAAPPLPVGYSPGWLPDGFAEQGRTYSPDGTVSRIWGREPLFPKQQSGPVADPWLGMSTGPYREDLVLDDEFGGVTGSLSAIAKSGTTTFTWLPDPAVGTVVSAVVEQVPDGRAVLEQVVRSTRPDSATTSVPLLVGSGPHAVRGTPDDWRVEVSDARWEDALFTAALTTRQPFIGGKPVVVRGVWGIVGEHGVAVEVAPDRWLSVQPVPGMLGMIPEDRLVAIANIARVDPHPDLSWLGKR